MQHKDYNRYCEIGRAINYIFSSFFNKYFFLDSNWVNFFSPMYYFQNIFKNIDNKAKWPFNLEGKISYPRVEYSYKGRHDYSRIYFHSDYDGKCRTYTIINNTFTPCIYFHSDYDGKGRTYTIINNSFTPCIYFHSDYDGKCRTYTIINNSFTPCFCSVGIYSPSVMDDFILNHLGQWSRVVS